MMTRAHEDEPGVLSPEEASQKPADNRPDTTTAGGGGIGAEELRERRKKAGLTQAELSNALGVSLRTIARWETGESKPNAAQFQRLNDLAQRGAAQGVATALLGRALLGPLMGPGLGTLAAVGLGLGVQSWFANRGTTPPEPRPLPAPLRDALLEWSDNLDTSPRRLREALAAMIASAAEAGCITDQLRNLLAHEAELPDQVRATLLAMAEALDLPPRKLRAALLGILGPAKAVGLDDEELQALLLGTGERATR